MSEEFDKKNLIQNFQKKSWRELEQMVANSRTFGPNYLNCYVDPNKTTSKVVCGYAYRSYNLTNVFKMENISDKLPGEGIGVIYSKNVAFKMLQLHHQCKSNYLYIDNSYFSKYYDKKITRFRIMTNDIHPHTISNLTPTTQVELEPWRKRNDSDLFILLCPPTGSLLQLYGVKKGWLEHAISQIRSKTNRQILIRFKNYDFMTAEQNRRFNKLARRYKNISYDPTITDANLLTLFEQCYAVVAPASGVGVIAASKGIPVFSENIGPVASISLHDYSLINDPIYPDRELWLNTILNHEFTLNDIFSGEWLVRLKQIYPKELKRILSDQINLLRSNE